MYLYLYLQMMMMTMMTMIKMMKTTSMKVNNGVNVVSYLYGRMGAGAVASLKGGRTAPGDTRPKIICLWLNLERTLDKRRGKMGVVKRRQLKKVITFSGND